jgi:hypothetical protein
MAELGKLQLAATTIYEENDACIKVADYAPNDTYSYP